jgi:hypothetical protein
MKNLTIITLFCSLLLPIFACQQPSPAPKKEGEAKITSMGTAINPSIIIDPDKAKAADQAWVKKRAELIQLFIKNKVGGDSIYLAKGFHVPLRDMQSIVNNIGNTNQLFAMQGIQLDSTTRQPQITLIFQAPDKNGVLQYFDFTSPCPSVCPDTK